MNQPLLFPLRGPEEGPRASGNRDPAVTSESSHEHHVLLLDVAVHDCFGVEISQALRGLKQHLSKLVRQTQKKSPQDTRRCLPSKATDKKCGQIFVGRLSCNLTSKVVAPWTFWAES